jgi:Amino acid permease
MFLGLSYLAVQLQIVPSEKATVISEVGRAVFGGGLLGTGLLVMLQVATTLILILAANTSFADFPRLASFQASDDFMPRPLTKRGHRLVFSNGIIGLAVASTVLVVLFQADVHRLIPLYAIGVFASFTLSQAGMAKRHLRLREPGWRRIRGSHDGSGVGRDRHHEVRRRGVGRDCVRPRDDLDPGALEPAVRA